MASFTVRVIRNDHDSTELTCVTVDTSTNEVRVSGSPAVDLDLLLRALSAPAPPRSAFRSQPLRTIRAPESGGTRSR